MMMRLLVLLIAVSGCTAPREAMRDLPTPRSLDDVNRLLGGATVALQLADGRRVTGASQVTVSPDSVRFSTRRATRPGAVATADVLAITRVRGRGTRYGAMMGLVPGLLVIYTGIKESQSRRDGQREAGRAGLGLSVPILLLGGAAGAWLGQLTTPGETVTVYRGPVSRYAPSLGSPGR